MKCISNAKLNLKAKKEAVPVLFQPMLKTLFKTFLAVIFVTVLEFILANTFYKIVWDRFLGELQMIYHFVTGLFIYFGFVPICIYLCILLRCATSPTELETCRTSWEKLEKTDLLSLDLNVILVYQQVALAVAAFTEFQNMVATKSEIDRTSWLGKLKYTVLSIPLPVLVIAQFILIAVVFLNIDKVIMALSCTR